MCSTESHTVPHFNEDTIEFYTNNQTNMFQLFSSSRLVNEYK